MWCESVCLTSDMDVGLHYTQIVSVWGKTITQNELTEEHRQDQGWEEEVKGPSAAPAVVLGYIPLEKKQWQGMGVNILW